MFLTFTGPNGQFAMNVDRIERIEPFNKGTMTKLLVAALDGSDNAYLVKSPFDEVLRRVNGSFGSFV